MVTFLRKALLYERHVFEVFLMVADDVYTNDPST